MLAYARVVKARLAPAVAAAIWLATASACSSGTTGKSDVDLTGQWSLASGQIDGQPIPTPVGTHLTLTSQTGKGTQADAGCWVVNLRATVDGSMVTFTQTTQSSTLPSCPPSYVQSDWDGRYLDALLRIDRAERDDGARVLTGPGISLSYANA